MQTISTLSVSILSRDADTLKEHINTYNNKQIAITQCVSAVADFVPEDATILLADPDLAVQVIEHCHSLAWCQSTWAGNAPLLRHPKRDYILTGVKGVFGKLMREYVFAYLLAHYRKLDTFAQAQQHTDWCQPATTALFGKTLGIMGPGSIAQAIVPVALAFDMRVIGLSRSGTPQTGYEAMFTPDNKAQFASQCDMVLNLLPDTPQTKGIIDAELLSALPAGTMLINAGRGNAIVQDDLMTALDKGSLIEAVLDVFETEPLPAAHPFWHHPNIKITQHTAALSYPKDVAGVFMENAERYLSGQALSYVFDFEKGY